MAAADQDLIFPFQFSCWFQEPALAQGWKYVGVRLTEDMTPELKQEILSEREERKRVHSRGWHAHFESKGVT